MSLEVRVEQAPQLVERGRESSALTLTLRYRVDGTLAGETLGYCRLMAALSSKDVEEKQALLRRAGSIKAARLGLPVGGSPLGVGNERAALQLLHGAAAQLTGPDETPIESDRRLLEAGAGAGAEQLSGRGRTAVEFRLQRKQAVAASRRAAMRELGLLEGTSGGWGPGSG